MRGASGLRSRASAARATLVAVALAVIGAGTGVAVAQLAGSGAADPVARPNAVITAVEPAQAASFAVLRGDAGAPAQLTPDAQHLVSVGLGPDVGASASLARYATTGVDGSPRYVIPGHGWMCLASGDGQGSCNRTEEVERGYGIGARPEGASTVLEGLVPDGVSSVEVTGDAGASAQVTPVANVWTTATTFTPRSVRWTGPDGVAHDVPVGGIPEGSAGPPPGG